MGIDEFKYRMNQFKQARGENPLLSYWEWKESIPRFADGTDGILDSSIIDQLKNNARTELTPLQQKELFDNITKYSKMSGTINPVFDIRDAADVTPVGNVLTSKDIYDAAKNRDFVGAGLISLSAVLPGVVGKLVKRYIPTVTRTSESKINALINPPNLEREIEWHNARNRSIERIYDPDVRKRASEIKSKYGVDILKQYDKIHDFYTNNYESVPKAKVSNLQGDAVARMNIKDEAKKAWDETKKPADLSDFELQVRKDVIPSREITDHEVNHWWTFEMMKNPDWRKSELQKITKDFEGGLHETNPLDPDNTKYFKDWMEQNAYGINVVNSMKELNIPFTKKNVIKFINAKPNTSSLKKAAYQFKNLDLYYKWLQTMPLVGVAGAAYMINSEDTNTSYK